MKVNLKIKKILDFAVKRIYKFCKLSKNTTNVDIEMYNIKAILMQ